MKSTSRVLFFVFVFFSFQSFSQKKLVNLMDLAGDRGASIEDMYAAGKDTILVDGYFWDKIVLGHDTLSGDGGRFLAWLGGERIHSSMAFTGRVLGVGQGVFCVANWQCISKFDFSKRRIWDYTLPLRDSVAWSSWSMRDICFDDLGNTYMLMAAGEKTYLDVKTKIIRGPGMVILKVDSVGELSGYTQFSDPMQGTKLNRYLRLKIHNNKLCAYGGHPYYYSARVMDLQLNEVEDTTLQELCRFSLWDGDDYFRIERVSQGPLQPFALEKYNIGKGLIRKGIFGDVIPAPEEIQQYDLLNIDKRKLLVAYVKVRGPSKIGEIRDTQLHLLVLRKKKLTVKKHLVLDCERLYSGSMNYKMVFHIVGKDVLIAHQYDSHSRIGNLSFGNIGDSTSQRKAFFIVKQALD